MSLLGRTIGVVGLGKLGRPLARNLLAAGHDVVAFDVLRPDMASSEEGGSSGSLEWGESPEEVSTRCSTVISVLPNDKVLTDVCGDGGGLLKGFAAANHESPAHISVSTVGPNSSRRLAKQHREEGGNTQFLTAPVFARPDGMVCFSFSHFFAMIRFSR